MNIDPDALASALPAGLTYQPHVTGDSDLWSTRRIAEFQAEKLAESGYRLVYVGDDMVGDAECICQCGCHREEVAS